MRDATPDLGLFATLFAVLLVAWCWPVVSIPQGLALPLWLFAVWGAGVIALWRLSRARADGGDGRRDGRRHGRGDGERDGGRGGGDA